MSLDHGVLNVPLEKRGNFHRELDDHLAAEKRRKEDALFLRKYSFDEAKAEAKRLFPLMDKALVKAEAKRRGIKLSGFNDVLRDIRDFKPRQAPGVFAMLTIK
ncbi:hypothetical protein ACFL9S_10980 [Erwinia sp. AnSW2-5]|uniref:hypothetical protein n=1 Tax=Erwinia sp. AnSW2-5 TaxID=3367692 RepID=UPI00385882B4